MGRARFSAARTAAWLAALAHGLPGAALALSIADAGQGNVPVLGTNAAGLSGLARQAGDQYHAVEDSSSALLYPIAIPVDPVTGFVGAVSVGTPLALEGGDDLEAVSFHPSGELFAADETGSAIRAHSLVDGSITRTVAVPAIYATSRPNQSFESMALEPGGAGLWAVNEAALTVDGPNSTHATGMLLRLQHFDAALAPDGQWAYQTEPIPGAASGPVNQLAIGVSDIELLPDGTLLVMERNMGGVDPAELYFEISIFAVDLAGATDTSDLASLVGASFAPVQKTLLWRENVGLVNFEAMALGPELAGGDHSLLLLSEGGVPDTTVEPVLRALRVRLVPIPEPGSAVLLGLGLLGLGARRRARRSR